MLELNDFCINRCCAGGLTLSDFVRLANDVGVHNIELRTDIHR
ncbi:inosose isomerase, partial [Lactobacillus sp. XV13L]|nr:inosose isomerase [Lactobacillus sp. XV13L]